jgi:hypothetical protein
MKRPSYERFDDLRGVSSPRDVKAVAESFILGDPIPFPMLQRCKTKSGFWKETQLIGYLYAEEISQNIPNSKLMASKYLATLNYLATGNRERERERETSLVCGDDPLGLW